MSEYRPGYVTVNSDSNTYELPRTNPYLIDDDCEPLLVRTQFYIPNDLLIKAQQIEHKSCTIKIICIIDMTFSVLYFYMNFILGIFLGSISTAGYLSTVYYKRSLLCCYMIYQYFQVAARYSNLIIYTIAIADTKNTTGMIVTETGSETGNVVILSLLCVGQMVIAYYVTDYYKLLPSSADKERIQLSSV